VKGVLAIRQFAEEKGLKLNVNRITSSDEAKQFPSGFGVFALVKDGKLPEDHFISKKRFKTILEKELN